MAGICGIIDKSSQQAKSNSFISSTESMISKLSINAIQLRKIHSIDNCYFGSVVSLSERTNENFIYNKQLELYLIIDGQAYLSESQTHVIREKFNLPLLQSTNEYLPYLYLSYGKDFIKHITGWHNIFIYDKSKKTQILLNDRLGYLPLFIYESDSIFLFSSKIESILASGLINHIEFDYVSIAEQALFNYPLSNNTLIRNISLFSSATIYVFSSSQCNQTQYWSPSELIIGSPIPKNKSLGIIDEALCESINKPIRLNNKPFYLTLTGGWDGRLILSYLLRSHRERLRSFSFGADYSPDVTIPQKIAQNEGFFYKSFILNQEYLNNSFLDSADKTIRLSNGARSYRRSHYQYSIQNLDRSIGLVMSGNFGDEILKFSHILPSEVISKELISYIQSDFTHRPNLSSIHANFLIKGNYKNSHLNDELNNRLDRLENELSICENTSQKFNYLKLSRIANRYFGAEVNSYNDFIYNYSPFIDYGFLKAFNQTCFCGNYHPFNSNKIIQKQMTSLLYAKLIKRNDNNLMKYPTDRGFSFSDLSNPLGKLIVYYIKNHQKDHIINDPYFLEQADNIFETNYYNIIKSNTLPPELPLVNISETQDFKNRDKYLSLNYWMIHIAKEYKR